MKPKFMPVGRLLKFRHTLCRWDRVEDETDVARLARATTDEHEATGHRCTTDSGWEVIARSPHRTVAAEEIGEWYACTECGRVTRRPRDNSYAEAHIYHYTNCKHANWMRHTLTSQVIGAPMEFCDGVGARRWRCGICYREHAESAIELRLRVPVPHTPDGCRPRPVVADGVVIGHLSWLHYKHCALNPKQGPCPDIDSLRRVREALGQEVLFAAHELEEVSDGR